MEEELEIPKLPERRPTTQEEWALVRQNYQQVTDELMGLKGFLDRMKGGTLRTCYFLARFSGKGKNHQVLTEDSKGETVVAVHDDRLFGPLKCGDLVLVAGDPMTGFAIVGRCEIQPGTGSVVVFERHLGDNKIEVNLGDRREVYWSAQDLTDQITEGKVKPGAQLVGKAGPNIAFSALPVPDGLARFQYLVNEDAPDVKIERDIGAPPPCLFEVLKFFRMEMENPSLRRKYGARPLLTRLFQGPPGGGKTFALKALHRGLYDVTEEITGLDEKQVGRRVLKMKAASMLSMWLGESEKNFERFFDEAVEIARKPVGKKKRVVPTLIIIEEFEAIARQRQGQAHDPVERIMTTLLQRLDPINEELSSGIICIIATTNEPGLIDRAALRRIGGKIEYFGMLTKDSFPKVLEKHVAKLPMASNNGTKQHELRATAVGELTELLFVKDERPVAELRLNTQTDPLKKYRRDFLSGALVDRAVQEAAGVALDAEAEGRCNGIDVRGLAIAFNNQIKSVIDQLSEQNAHKYVDLPDGAQVERVKRMA